MRNKVSTDQVIECLSANRWVRTKAAEILGVNKQTIYDHVRKAIRMGIDVPKSAEDRRSGKPKVEKAIIGEQVDTGDFAKPIKHFPKEHQEDPFRSPVTNQSVDPERLEKVQSFVGRIGIHMARGNREAAQELFDAAFCELAKVNSDFQPLAETSITDVGIGVRIENMLIEEHGIRTLGDLPAAYHVALLATPHFGTSRLDDLWRAVMNFCFRQDNLLRDRLSK